MNTQVAVEAPRSTGKSVLALLAGFLAVIVLSVATDVVLHAIGFYPPLGQRTPSRILVFATVYRCIYAVLGSYVTARLAPNRPMGHALLGGVIGLVLSTAGAVATWNRDLGPHWYPVSLILTAIPCAWIGGKLCLLHQSSAAEAYAPVR